MLDVKSIKNRVESSSRRASSRRRPYSARVTSGMRRRSARTPPRRRAAREIGARRARRDAESQNGSGSDAHPGRLAGDLANHRLTAEDVVAKVNLATLGHRPTAAEVAALTPRIRDRDSIADVQWALFDRIDFLYNS